MSAQHHRPPPSPFRLAARAAQMNPSLIRELLKLSEQPGVRSMAGGLPQAAAFPLPAVREAMQRILGQAQSAQAALQYGPSEGHGPLRDWVAAYLRAKGIPAQAAQVLITAGSQQGLDLAGKVLIDPGSRVLVEQPTYLGALQAFKPYEPLFKALPADAHGVDPAALAAAQGARLAYLVPSFQNPSGHSLSGSRREELAAAAMQAQVPLIEDDPYGELWFDAPPPAPLASRWPEGTLYLGSFSKMLAPGLRVGWLLAPAALYPKLLQAKQAADLHTGSLAQRLIAELLTGGSFRLEAHLQTLRAHLRRSRDALHAALQKHLGGYGVAHGVAAPACRWRVPAGGMFIWLELPAHVDTLALLPQAIAAGVAYLPGAAFFAEGARGNTMRLSFATLPPDEFEPAVAALARVLAPHLSAMARVAGDAMALND